MLESRRVFEPCLKDQPMKPLHPLAATLSAAAMLSLGASPASAAGEAPINNARCFVVSNIFAKSSDDKAKQAAVLASYFYLGRLTGTPAQIEAAIVAQAKTVDPQNAGTTMQACAQAVAAKSSELQAIGQRLSAAAPAK
jgi:hypothetical protein